MILRRAIRQDLERIARLEQAGIVSPWSREQLGALFEHGTGMVLVAEKGQGLCGYLALQVTAPEAELLRIVVAPELRRQGFGSRLLDFAWERLADLGVCSCYLEVRRSNTAARRLYGRHGFASCGIRPGYFRGPREDALVLKKELQTLF